MDTEARFIIPLLSQLVPDGIRAGTGFTVEFDAQSQWFAVAVTMAARYLQVDGRVSYLASSRHPDDAKRDLKVLGVDVAAMHGQGRLTVDDWYSVTLTSGRIESAGAQTSVYEPIEGGVRIRSLKVADLSIAWLKLAKHGPEPFDIVETWPPGALDIVESVSEILRFNEENVFLEWMVSRVMPNERRAKRIVLYGVVRGIHSDSLYRRMENATDGVIEVRVMERGDEIKNLLRITSLKGQRHDNRWHEITIGHDGATALSM